MSKSKLTIEIERELLIYYRFHKSLLICNEVSLRYGIADLFGIKKSGKNFASYEFEIKISKSDFQNELRSKNKIKKHNYYSSGKSAPNKPNYFYFVTIPELKDFAVEFISKLNKKYGLIIFEKSNRGDMNNFNIVGNANRLCNIGNCDTRLIWCLLSRATSAYCGIIKKEQN